MALVIALIVVSALTISTAATITLVSSNQRSFTRDKLETRAFNTAEAGLNTAIAQLRTVDVTGAQPIGFLYPGPGTTDHVDCCDGLGQWRAEKTSASVWTIYSEGLSPSGEVLRKLSVQTSVDTTTITTSPSLAWSYGFFVASPSSCTNLVGTVKLSTPIFVNGDLCLSGTQAIAEPNSSGPESVDLYVQGKLYISGSAAVGTSPRPILKATITQGCVRNNQSKVCSNAAQSRVYAKAGQYYSAQSTLTKPTVDGPATYAEGDWDSPSCSIGSFTFDNDSTRNTSVGTFDLFPASAYDCTVYEPGGGGTVQGRLAWNPATSTLTVDGTIFIDGNMALNGGDQAQYAAGYEGTIYVNGTATTNGNSAICGPPATVSGSSCNGLWDGDYGTLGFVVLNANNAATTWSMSGNAEYNVLVYVVGKFSETGTAKVTGPVITDSGFVAGTADHSDIPDPPDGMPGGGSTTVNSSWRVVPGTWAQLLNSSG